MVRRGGGRATALVVAAVLGIAAGVTLAVWTGSDGGSNDSGDQELSAAEDPLSLGIEQADLAECDGSTVLVVDAGRSANDLVDSAADWPGAKYAATDGSCATAWPQVDGEQATYVVYLDGFDSPFEACQQRMTPDHKGDSAVRLTEGAQDPLQCVCYLDVDSIPEVGEGLEPTTETGMFVAAYQDMMVRGGAVAPDTPVTGVFDRRWADATREFQTESNLSPLGYVDAGTWRAISEVACGRYVN